MACFRGFLRPRKKYAKYRKLPYFTYKFGGFLGEDLGESLPPNAILKSQCEKQARLKKELGDRWRGKKEFEDLVFTTGMGSPCSRYIVEKEIKKVIKRMKEKEAVLAVQENREPRIIRDFHPHTIRHTFATRCFEKKMEPKVVQKLMGHSSISITMNIYTHVLENKMNEEIQKFGSANTEQINPYADLNIPKRTITAMSHC